MALLQILYGEVPLVLPASCALEEIVNSFVCGTSEDSPHTGAQTQSRHRVKFHSARSAPPLRLSLILKRLEASSLQTPAGLDGLKG